MATNKAAIIDNNASIFRERHMINRKTKAIRTFFSSIQRTKTDFINYIRRSKNMDNHNGTEKYNSMTRTTKSL
ncbi:unnamed protein product, partial [Rotaria sordida]